MDIVLTDLEINGREEKVILHAPKNGFFYVINRETGKLISAEPFVETTWASHIDRDSGRPVEIKEARYESAAAKVTPSAWGAHSWHAMSFNPETRLVYIPTLHSSIHFDDSNIDLKTWQAKEFTGGMGVAFSLAGSPRSYPASLIAWDPLKQNAAWSVPQANFWNGGTLTTGGNLVFQGTSDGYLKAFNATTGEELWHFNVGLGVSAPPITYKINGRQYIALLVGWGGGYAGLGGPEAYNLGWSYRSQTRRLIAFSLEGNMKLPVQTPPLKPKPIQDLNFVVDKEQALFGQQLYGYCGSCHGLQLWSGGMAPDLRASTIPLDKTTFASVVRNGALNQNGMPSFPEFTDEQLEALQHFIRASAHEFASQYEALIAKK